MTCLACQNICVCLCKAMLHECYFNEVQNYLGRMPLSSSSS